MTGTDPATARLFFAFWPPAPVARLIETRQPNGLSGRPVARDDLHLTLAFLGSVPRAAIPALTGLPIIRCPAVAIRLAHRRTLPRSRCIVLGLEGCPPALAAAQLAFVRHLAALGLDPDNRAFYPHVTLMRGVAGSEETRVIDPIDWVLDEVRLVASIPATTGSRYTSLASWRAAQQGHEFMLV